MHHRQRLCSSANPVVGRSLSLSRAVRRAIGQKRTPSSFESAFASPQLGGLARAALMHPNSVRLGPNCSVFAWTSQSGDLRGCFDLGHSGVLETSASFLGDGTGFSLAGVDVHRRPCELPLASRGCPAARSRHSFRYAWTPNFTDLLSPSSHASSGCD
jgi:hypothetical protein